VPEKIHEILSQPHGTQKAADHSAKDQCEADRRDEKENNITDLQRKKVREMREIIAATLR
jgi:hypothetical protein